jgi:hypothetical protein
VSEQAALQEGNLCDFNKNYAMKVMTMYFDNFISNDEDGELMCGGFYA